MEQTPEDVGTSSEGTEELSVKATSASDGTPGEADYEYDVFVSYRRDRRGQRLIAPWISGVVSRIHHYLGEELPMPVSVFFDVDEIQPGMTWPLTLATALGRSKCLLPVWSPEYFRSQWCLAEWQSFRERERLVGGDCCLIVPIKAHDGKWFPDDAQQVQHYDLTGYTATTTGFWSTLRADELDQRLQELARRLADVILSAPVFRPDWPVIERPPTPLPANIPRTRL